MVPLYINADTKSPHFYFLTLYKNLDQRQRVLKTLKSINSNFKATGFVGKSFGQWSIWCTLLYGVPEWKNTDIKLQLLHLNKKKKKTPHNWIVLKD